MFSGKSQLTTKGNGHQSPKQLIWVAKPGKSKKGSSPSNTSPRGRRFKCLTQEELNNLRGKQAAIFVSIDNSDFEPDKVDAMLDACCRAGLVVDLIVMDHNTSFNKVHFDCTGMSEKDLREKVYPLGEECAKKWIRSRIPIIQEYKQKYPGQVNLKYGSCNDDSVDFGDVRIKIDQRIENHSRFQEALSKITEELEQPKNDPKKLPWKIRITVEEYFRNKKEHTPVKINNSTKYIKKELPFYYILSLYNYLIYTSAETPALRYVRKLVGKQERAKYLQVDLSAIDPTKTPLDTVQKKIDHGEGIQHNYLDIMHSLLEHVSGGAADIYKKTSATPVSQPSTAVLEHSTVERCSSAPPELPPPPKRSEQPKSRASSCPGSFFHKEYRTKNTPPIQQTTTPIPSTLTTIDIAGEAVCRGDYKKALTILMQIDYSKLSPADRLSYDMFLTATRSAMEYREGILITQMKEHLIQRHNGNGKAASSSIMPS